MSFSHHLRPTLQDLRPYRPHEYRAGLIRLDANESPFSLEPEERDAFAQALAGLDVHRYPEVSGRPLREALAQRWGVSADELLLGNGSDELISMLVTAFCASSRGPSSVLYPVPTFGEYRSLTLLHGARPVEVPLGANWELDESRLAEAIAKERPSLAFFASPNNPTGNSFAPQTLDALYAGFDGCFVVDEAYADYSGASHMSQVRARPSFCVMRSLSKIGLAGLRLGALVGPRELVAELDKVRLPYNVNSLSQALACLILSEPARLERRIHRVLDCRRHLVTELHSVPGLTVYPSDSNFVLVRTSADAAQVFSKLLSRGVLVRNLSQPGPLENCLRITVGTESENAQCLAALHAAVGA